MWFFCVSDLHWNIPQWQEEGSILNDLFPKIINNKSDMYHRNYRQYETERFACYKCGSTYKQKTHLTRHMKHECGLEPQFHCPRCPKRYKQKNTLRLHMYRHHC
jgi:hypothetical protein